MQLWFADCETYAHDYLWVFKRQEDGEVRGFWNDSEGVRDFLYSEQPVLCGFNFRDYDSQILKATMLDWSPEEINHLSQTIIQFEDRSIAWALFDGQPWVTLPPIIDVFHDIVPKKSLKEIEGHIGMSIEESSVPFDIERELTDDERDEVYAYCLHDVEATEAFYDLRYDYIKAKSDLCEMRGIDPLMMLKHTNARIVSEVLGAETYEHPHDPDDRYEIPENIDLTAIPMQIQEFVLGFHGQNCEGTVEPIEFMFHGCPTVVGLGGIHAAIPSYQETATKDRIILLQDIGSFYPSLIINNGYMSRAVSDPSIYKQFYDARMTAKKTGDKATAEAAKLVLNTTYGTFKDGYNRLYDPMQGTRVCLSGQLYVLDLIEQLHRNVPSMQVIQLNTDGWVISCNKDDRPRVDEAVEAWSERTGFTVDTSEVEKIVQANVNNYVMRTLDGKVKTKGGVVAKYAGGDFKSNSATIIDKAVVDYLLDGVPIAETVEACDDSARFQIIAKAGQTFQKVVHETSIVRACEHEYKRGVCVNCGINRKQVAYECQECEVQRCNRVYATTDKTYGGIFKVKMEDGQETGRSKIPLTPEHCLIDNENRFEKGLTTLDKSWYIALAKKKAHEFITRDKKERDQMAETAEPNNELQKEDAPKPTRRATTKKTEPVEVSIPTFKERLLSLQKDMAGVAESVEFDGVVTNISYEYADTQQYKKRLAALCSKYDLIFKLDIYTSWLGVVSPDGKTPTYGAQADGHVTISAVEADEFETYAISGFGSNVQAGYCFGVAQTNALRNFILNNWLLDNKGREGDDQAMNSGASFTSGSGGSGYVAPAEKAGMKAALVAEGKNEYATKMFAEALYTAIMAARAVEGHKTFGAKMLSEHFEKDGTPKLREDGNSTMKKTAAVTGLGKAEEITNG